MTRPVLIVHGGAGRIPPESRKAREAGLRAALDAGWRVLTAGGPALEAVVAAIAVLEDDPHFNAGRGSSLTRDGRVEMDAGLMDGRTLEVGAVAAVSRVANPIRLAYKVLTDSPHILLVGGGAEAFADRVGLPLVEPKQLITQERLRRLAERLTAQAQGDTVGAVALDVHGHLAAGTSTGGVLAKWSGRVGDSPLVGCGFYAEDGLAACSTTGLGETIARALLAYRAVLNRAMGLSPEEAGRAALAFMEQRVGGEAGLILLTPEGRWAAVWSTRDMSYACRTPEEEIVHP